MDTKYIQASKIIFLGLVISVGLSYVAAWTGPSSNPPNGNVSLPINAGSGGQAKAGSLGIGSKPSGYASFPRTGYALDAVGKGYANHFYGDDLGLGGNTPAAGTAIDAKGTISATGVAVYGAVHTTGDITDDNLATGGADQPLYADKTGKLK
jgi:hypothetical protein